MARKKDAQALFEVISKNKEKHTPPKFGIPEWMAKDCRPKAEGDPVAPEEDEAPPAPKVEQPPEPPRTVARPEPAPMRFDEPAFELDHGRVKFSLSIVSAGVSVLGVLVLVGVAFWLGRHSAPSGGTPAENTPIAAGKGQQGTPTPAPKPSTKKPAKKPGPILGDGKLVKGKYYLVIQSLQGAIDSHRQDAEAIQKFCHERGVPAVLMKYTSGGKTTYHVWAMQPFEHGETLDGTGTPLAEKVQALGLEYARISRNKYNFNQRNRSGKVEGWFLPY